MAATYIGVQMKLPLLSHPRCPCCGGPAAHGERYLVCAVCGYRRPYA
ncbi:hypothetical protein HRbin24_00314 [bacterium HR24]|jgi:ribosomal protein L37E|nr:hypothetical protein HRbin24_00314 [bacterium HR24]